MLQVLQINRKFLKNVIADRCHLRLVCGEAGEALKLELQIGNCGLIIDHN